MDTSIWVAILSSGAAGGILTAIVNSVLNRRKLSADSKSAEIEATEGAFEALQAQVEHLKKSLDEAYTTTRKMQEVINEFRKANVELTKELAKAQMALAKAQARESGCKGCADKTA